MFLIKFKFYMRFAYFDIKVRRIVLNKIFIINFSIFEKLFFSNILTGIINQTFRNMLGSYLF